MKSTIVFSQDSATYQCNAKVIYNCEYLRQINEAKGPALKVNYKKMLKKDKPVIHFLNFYHSDTVSLQGLKTRLHTVNIYYFRSFKKGDTVECLGTVKNRGLVVIQLRYSYNESQQKLIHRFYHISINNNGGRDDQPFDYHYKIFLMLNFCFKSRYSCYDFEENF